MVRKNSRIPKYTARQVAEMLGLTPDGVRSFAHRHNLGTYLNPRIKLFSEHDIDAMRDRDNRGRKRAKDRL